MSDDPGGSVRALFERMAKQNDTPLSAEEIASTAEDGKLDDRVWGRVSTLLRDYEPARLAALPPGRCAYIATRLFEWEIGNGGLHQFFYNFPDPGLLDLVLDGYSLLGLTDVRTLVETAVRPLVAEEQEWRESLRDGRLDTFFDSYGGTALEAYDEQVGFHDDVRIRYLRAHPEDFTG